MNERCFALRTNNRCSAITVDRCKGYMGCPFYKPMWKYEKDLKLAEARIKRLPKKQRKAIYKKYYEENRGRSEKNILV